MSSTPIKNVSDTALWVAVYRAQENERADALFRDPYAKILAGDRGREIAERISNTQYTAWSVVIRTCIIDDYILNLINHNEIDMVINLGAGLDARPYRMNFPASLRWIEVDYPHIIQLKKERLEKETPKCILERVELDLSDLKKRSDFFSREDFKGKKIAVLTEGVTPYLSNDQVASLAQDLRVHPHFRFWIVDYFSPQVMRYMQSPRRKQEMKNAPFLFNPESWFHFFEQLRWGMKEIRYIAEESDRLGRAIPMPSWVKVLRFFLPSKRWDASRKFVAYVLLEPK